MKIFITGGTGGIGKLLIPKLLQAGHNLVLLQLPHENNTSLPNLLFVKGDIGNSASYASALNNMEAVIHLAGITHTNNQKLYFSINAQGTKDLVEMCELKGVKRFIYVSTRAISKDGGGYSASKQLAEQYVKASKLDWTILRPSEVSGAAEGEAISKLIGTIKTQPFIPIIGDGSYKIAPVKIADVLQAVNDVLENKKTYQQIYTIAGPTEYSYKEFINLILKKQNVKKIKIHIPITLLRLVAWLIAHSWLKKPPLVQDQIPRLLCPKSADIGPAKKDFGYNPESIL